MAGAAWAVAVVLGMCDLVRHQMIPSAAAQVATNRWPINANITRNNQHPTLIMLLHPQCPCSRASLHELVELISRSSGKLDARILFVQPPNAPAHWLDGSLWRQAGAIPDVTVSIDKDGHDAAIFGASTSGQVLVYDAAGTLRFSGGITDGRGHEGDNPGLLSILSLLREGKSSVTATPVYGCSLGVCKAELK